jgi:hypothetical protein
MGTRIAGVHLAKDVINGLKENVSDPVVALRAALDKAKIIIHVDVSILEGLAVWAMR